VVYSNFVDMIVDDIFLFVVDDVKDDDEDGDDDDGQR
jgi:hypothetical protein